MTCGTRPVGLGVASTAWRSRKWASRHAERQVTVVLLCPRAGGIGDLHEMLIALKLFFSPGLRGGSLTRFQSPRELREPS